tara:strand:+ start:114 stop:305 length:192 start_codon:yes stop_codon:yes gene_type:complete
MPVDVPSAEMAHVVMHREISVAVGIVAMLQGVVVTDTVAPTVKSVVGVADLAVLRVIVVVGHV